MSETESLKVYELAKELGIDSISLLDKLKGLNIKVKNHMSELGTDDARAARSALRKPAEGEKTTKKSSARSSSSASAATREPTAKKAAPTRKKTPAADAPAATPAPDTAETASADRKASAPVIRRRVKTDGMTETVTHPPGMRASIAQPVFDESQATEAGVEAMDAPETSLDDSSGDSFAASARESAVAGTDSESADAGEETLHADAESVGTAAAISSAGVSASAGAAAHVTAASSSASGAHAPSGASAYAASTGAGATAAGAVRTHAGPTPHSAAMVGTTGVTPRAGMIGAGPAISSPSRRSILKIVEPTAPTPPKIIKPAPAPAPQAKTVVRGTTTQQDKDGYRIIKMTKENLDQMVEEEAAKKRGGGGRVPEIRPEDVRFADYRKKEMVFLPKKKKIPVGKEIRKTTLTQMNAKKRIVVMKDTITVADFADQMGVKATDVVRKLMMMGQMVSMNHSIDFDTATLLGNEYKYEVKNNAFNEAELIAAQVEDKAEDLTARPPVVTIMGHVDHGKTTLLDSIREANVAAGEAGGITQHIGAYTVEKNGKLITFIDTPGHEAFTVMRARGANVTDIVILVVSADDGVMPQTREALSHAQAAKVPIIVAVNKIDKPGANPEKIKQGLAELNLLAEDWGGETMFIPVSALKKTNIDKLLEGVLLQAEVLDLKANADGPATGTVLEARLEKGRGPVVSLLVKRGTLRVGDAIVSGSFPGRVKAMMDDKGRTVKEVLPGIAAEVLGFEGLPNAGEKFDVTADEAGARDVAQHRIDQNRAKSSMGPLGAAAGKVSLEAMFSKITAGDLKELNIILKGDVFGSVEAIRDSLVKLSTEKVKVKVIHSAPGGITESDIQLASASNALVIGFNVRPETKARQLAESEHVEIKTYAIIYELLDDVKLAMTGLLDKLKVEKFLGRAEVRQLFTVPKLGTVAGSAVIDGKILRGANVRLLRDSRVIYDGKMSSLRRFKDDAKEVATGFECGIGIENYNDLKVGDIIEAYQIDLVTPKLEA